MGVQHSRDAEFLKCKIIQYRLDLQTAIKLQQKSDLPYRLATSKHWQRSKWNVASQVCELPVLRSCCRPHLYWASAASAHINAPV